MDLVFLHGGAAAGKLTTARELSARLGYPVFHNHLVVDLLTDIFPFGSEPFVRLREQMWLSVFTEASLAGRSLIFTFAPESTVAPQFPDRVRTAIESASGRVRFVQLTVSDAEQERRIEAASRRQFHKLSDVETLRSLRDRGEPAEQPPVDLAIDTDTSAAAQSAETIIARFELAPQPVGERYPAGVRTRASKAEPY